MAYVHATSWQETYAGLLDKSVIEDFNELKRRNMWSSFLKNESNLQKAYVALMSDKIIGIASWRESNDQFELLTLYVLKEFQGLGIGKKLFKQIEKDTTKKGKHLMVWVLENNKSTAFYEKMGLLLNKVEKKNLGGSIVLESMFRSR
ncbi:GNAT family N-acetyltransferase, partial [Chlamydiales bacterium]|nr:GNAT family N-acetyltransferase [Chlamydiales bacterium]